MFKYLWTISALGRPIARQPLSILSRNGQVKIQRVRIGKPFFTQKRSRNILLSLVGTTLLCYFALEIVVEVEKDQEEQQEGNEGKLIKPREIDASVKVTAQEKHSASATHGNNDKLSRLEHKAQSNDKRSKDKDGEEDENLEDALFIPLGFVHELPRTYYKRSDPAWASFIELSRNRERLIHIRNELAGFVVGGVANSPSFQKTLGTPIQRYKYWLDIDFPEGPPPEYERSGIEITAEHVAWTTRPVSAIQYLRLQRNLQPLPMLSALWASGRVLWSLQLESIQAMLTLDSKPGNLEASSPIALLFLQKFIKASQHKDAQLNAGNEDMTLDLEDDASEDGLAEDSSEVPLRSGQSSGSKNLSLLRQHMKTALKAFEKTLARKWKHPPIIAERGTCLVSGLVQIEGPDAVCVMDVRASYHPQESRWVTYGVGLRRMQSRRQSPKGGD